MVAIAIAQIKSTSCLKKNLEICRSLIVEAHTCGAQIVFFPEASDFISSSPVEFDQSTQFIDTAEFVKELQTQARSFRIALSIGIHGNKPSGKDSRRANLLLWIDANGEILSCYQKIHMLEMRLNDHDSISEHLKCRPGDHIVPPFDTIIGKIGPMICYDLRFPMMAQQLVKLGAEILLYSSAFYQETGDAHWMPLLRARAIECQAYVIAPNQSGQHNLDRESYGHSMVIDPWGRVVAKLDKEENVLLHAKIDISQVARVREQMPLHDRSETYSNI